MGKIGFWFVKMGPKQEPFLLLVLAAAVLSLVSAFWAGERNDLSSRVRVRGGMRKEEVCLGVW
uniref:Uncharacterized protein n=1 Tax=Rhizophora mucronata TaxID=61149 RepID=A0A2P2ILS0_RHIMU